MRVPAVASAAASYTAPTIRASLNEVRSDFASSFSFCCADCRKRKTSTSVRFLGRRGFPPPWRFRCGRCNGGALGGLSSFLLTPLWQASGSRFMPPVASDRIPASLFDRFAGDAAEALLRLLVFLSPLTVTAVTRREGPVIARRRCG